ncbi:MAG TPA: GDSL-type esterase/lipase family protein, partial [Acidimicrobiales bacterium]|nr:GDSL-type esterase/lipase family protein [Acidimicrobiales bacterium]
MRRGPGRVGALVVALAATLLPLSSPDAVAQTRPSAPPSTVARVGVPQNIYAVGDSITTATGTAALGDEHPANSWVTGTNPSSFPDGRGGSAQVLSMRHRLGIAQGNAVNLAQNGRRMSDFDDQANRLPSSAQYVVVLLGGNDLCRPSVAEMTSEASYRSSFRAGLTAVQARAPNALVFVSSIPDIYNLWFLRKGSLKARTFWDNPTGFEIPCESLLENPGSTSSADENRRRQVRTRNIAFNRILEEECALVLRCRFDGHGLFRRTSNRVDPFSNSSPYLPESQWGFRDQDISHDQGTWRALCPANFNYSGCGDHFHPSHWGQAKLALAGHDFSYRFQSDSTAPTATIVPARSPDGAGVYARSVEVRFGGTDANGIRGQEVRVQGPDGVLGPWQPTIGLAPARTVSAVGTTYVQVRTLDRNGNLSASTTRSITIDPTAFGGVSGTVSGPAGPLAGIEVSLHDAGSSGALETVTTGADGTYAFTELVAGDEVKVLAHDPSGVHVDQWYDGAAGHGGATSI